MFNFYDFTSSITGMVRVASLPLLLALRMISCDRTLPIVLNNFSYKYQNIQVFRRQSG
ncbi:hypothetical protein [Nostoc sp. LPT]|uniref:hypothetical protein n=1 Tax=Nostoc sp. LPT TaxID=2815387 RepID=UPI001DE947EA|nr:hypothetical protein [Nostoc sp. LPT]MBN4005287.1 hypothetical protein [Nostoc sp. LPT]